MDGYDLWVDFMRMRNDGTVLASASNLRSGLRARVGDVLIGGSEDSNPARAEVVRVDIDGTILLQVLDAAGTGR